MIEISTIDQWARYSAYETIMQSWHSYENNNMRVVFDNWKGEIIPIAYDSILNDARNELIIEQDIIYDNVPIYYLIHFINHLNLILKNIKLLKIL